MARYIDAEMLTEEINTINERVVSKVRVGWSSWSILETIRNMPTADVRPERHGHWIEEGDIQICSECGEEHSWQDYRASYCDVCGAKMAGRTVCRNAKA